MRAFMIAASVLALTACTATTGGGIVDPGTGGGGGGGGSTTGACNTTTHVCSGEVNSVSYDAGTDTLTINNLVGVGGDNSYSRDAALDRNGFQAYTNDDGFHAYVALYQDTGTVHAGVVGTSDYEDYGYGGTVYGNTGTAKLPTSGWAQYDGDYAAIRVYSDGSPIRYADGDMTLLVDFNDFDLGGGVEGGITNRKEYDENGVYMGDLPDVGFVTASINGDKITSTTAEEVPSGMTGTMEGIFGGDSTTGNGEVAGVVVMTGGNVKESGVFILTQTSLNP